MWPERKIILKATKAVQQKCIDLLIGGAYDIRKDRSEFKSRNANIQDCVHKYLKQNTCPI